MMLPSTRARLCQCNQDIGLSLPMLDMHLVELYKLTKPLDRGCNPTTVAELKARQILPEHSTYETLTEEEAKTVFHKLQEKYPQLAEIEIMPLLPIENHEYENWHTKILRQIRAFNVHTEKAIRANNTIMQDKLYKAHTAQYKAAQAAKLEIATEVYNTKTIEFWVKNDVEGQSAINLANEIRKRWKDEEKSSLTESEADNKKAKSSLTESNASIKKE